MSDESAKETWTCMGVRQGSKDQRCTSWRDPNGKTLLYAEKNSVITGGLYEVMVTRTDGSTHRGHPVYTGRLPYDDPDLKAWRVAEMEAEQELARQARERKAKADDPFGKAMEPLIEYAKACRTGAQRDALIADVIRRLNTPWNRT
jgi:hypothetical protein